MVRPGPLLQRAPERGRHLAGAFLDRKALGAQPLGYQRADLYSRHDGS